MNSLATALITIRRSPYQSLAAIMILSLTFFVAYVFSLFMIVSEQVLRYFETRPQVIAFFALETPVERIVAVENSMKAKSYVTGVKVVSKEEALSMYQEENKDDPLLLELVTAQILPASIEVSGNTVSSLKDIKKDLESQSDIEEVVLQQDIIDSLSLWTKGIRYAGFASIIMLSITSLVIMIVVIGMKVVSKRPAIQIMRIIGATRWFVKSPFVFEGITYGLVSSLIGWGGMYAGILYLTPWLKQFLGAINVFPIAPEIFALQLAIGTSISVLLGAMAGSMAVGRIIKQ